MTVIINCPGCGARNAHLCATCGGKGCIRQTLTQLLPGLKSLTSSPSYMHDYGMSLAEGRHTNGGGLDPNN